MEDTKKPYRDKSLVQIPSVMWNAFELDNRLDTLSYFLQIRSLHKNPVFYNCSKAKLSRLLGVSYNTLIHHLRYLEEKGIVWYANGHIHLMGKAKLRKAYPGLKRLNKEEKLIVIQVDKDIKNTKVSVKSVPFLCNIVRQEKILGTISKTQALIKKSFDCRLYGDEAKFLKKENKREKKREARYCYPTMSNKTMASKLNRKSDRTAIRYKGVLKKMNIIDTERKFAIIPEEEIDNHFDVYFGFRNGARVYQSLVFKEVTSKIKIKNRDFSFVKGDFLKTYSFKQICYKAMNPYRLD